MTAPAEPEIKRTPVHEAIAMVLVFAPELDNLKAKQVKALTDRLAAAVEEVVSRGIPQ